MCGQILGDADSVNIDVVSGGGFSIWCGGSTLGPGGGRLFQLEKVVAKRLKFIGFDVRFFSGGGRNFSADRGRAPSPTWIRPGTRCVNMAAVIPVLGSRLQALPIIVLYVCMLIAFDGY